MGIPEQERPEAAREVAVLVVPPGRLDVADPAIEDLLAVARRIFNNHLVNTRGMLRELQRERRRV